MEGLAERLKALRQAHSSGQNQRSPAPQPRSNASAPAAESQDLDQPSTGITHENEDDETKIERLLAKTRDEIAIEGADPLDGESETHSSQSSEGERSRPDLEDEAHALAAESQKALKDAKSALREEQQRNESEEGQEDARMLRHAAKPRPVMIRTASSHRDFGEDGGEHGEDQDGLEDELAEALGIQKASLRVRPPRQAVEEADQMVHPDQSAAAVKEDSSPSGVDVASEARMDKDDQQLRTNSDEEEINALLARFSAIRPRHGNSRTAASAATSVNLETQSSAVAPGQEAKSDTDEVDARAGSPDPFLGLPSVPSAVPVAPSQPSEEEATHPSLGPQHNDIGVDVDLNPFRKLVGKDMDVGRLGAPSDDDRGSRGSRSKKPGSSRLPSSSSLLPSPPHSDSDSSSSSTSTDDATLCSLCANPASLTCWPSRAHFAADEMEYQGCGGDAYCSQCWVDAHERMPREERDQEHRTKDLPMSKSRRGRGDSKKRGNVGGRGSGRKAMVA